jgi:hypothetical protein
VATVTHLDVNAGGATFIVTADDATNNVLSAVVNVVGQRSARLRVWGATQTTVLFNQTFAPGANTDIFAPLAQNVKNQINRRVVSVTPPGGGAAVNLPAEPIFVLEMV